MEENKINVVENQPLVSIIVITYNSAKYVLETLESARVQTYQNIELIVSDDCSADNTVEICRQWVEENKVRFERTEIITTPHNTGIPANCNRGVKAAQGEWVKLIAGDDLLMDSCIENNINYIKDNDNCQILLSRVKTIKDGKVFSSKLPTGVTENFKFKTAHEQYRALILRYFGSTPSLFIKKQLFKIVVFDEELMYLEDFPFALNITKNGIPYFFMDKETVIYRIHNNSIMHGKKSIDFQKLLLNDRMLFDKKYRFPFLSKNQRSYEQYEFWRGFTAIWLYKWLPQALAVFIIKILGMVNIYRYLGVVR